MQGCILYMVLAMPSQMIRQNCCHDASPQGYGLHGFIADTECIIHEGCTAVSSSHSLLAIALHGNIMTTASLQRQWTTVCMCEWAGERSWSHQRLHSVFSCQMEYACPAELRATWPIQAAVYSFMCWNKSVQSWKEGRHHKGSTAAGHVMDHVVQRQWMIKAINAYRPHTLPFPTKSPLVTDFHLILNIF